MFYASPVNCTDVKSLELTLTTVLMKMFKTMIRLGNCYRLSKILMVSRTLAYH